MLKRVAAAGLTLAFGLGVARAEAPAFKPQSLVLKNIPQATGPAEALFNGKDLNDWMAWLGYRDPAQTYLAKHDAPIGVAGKGDIFTVVTEDGAPVSAARPGAAWSTRATSRTITCGWNTSGAANATRHASTIRKTMACCITPTARPARSGAPGRARSSSRS